MFIDNLIEKINEKCNPSVFGLDPNIQNIPSFIKEKFYSEHGKNIEGAAAAILYFNKILIDTLYDIMPAVKLQSAYYELYGIEGIKVFKQTIDYAKSKGLIVIGDVKRNDIDSTATAYSKAYLGRVSIDNDINLPIFDADAITVNPYLGIDGIQPFVNDCKEYNKGAFVLVKTSNKSSGEMQDLIVGNKSIYEIVAEYVHNWGSQLIGKSGYSSVGAVVGATYPEQAKRLRKIMPNTYFLVPGFGAQGAGAKDVVNCFNNDGLGAIINASRSIIYAYKNDKYKEKYSEEEFAQASREEAIRMRDEICDSLSK